MKTLFLRTEHNYDRDQASLDTGLRCQDKTLAQQQFKDQCDINLLMARYLESGELPQVTEGLTYGNFEGIFDFQSAMNAVRTAEGLFSQFPARIKNRFDNDPQKMLDFLAQDENRDEAEFLGLLKKEMPNETPISGSPDQTKPQAGQKSGGTTPDQATPPTGEKP